MSSSLRTPNAPPSPPSRPLPDRAVAAPRAAGPARFRARSHVSFAGKATRLDALRQESPLRFLHPDVERDEVRTSVLANTAGGIVGGDRLACAVEARDGARLLLTGQAAEKVYRSESDAAELDFSFASRDGAELEVLPQGTILFEGSRLERRTRLEIDRGGVLLYGEILHFGRAAMDEGYRTARLHDRTEIRVDGRLVAVDVLRLADETAQAMGSRAGLAGARCAGVAWLIHPEAPRFVGPLRAALAASEGAGVRVSAGCFDDGPLVVRWLGDEGAALRRSFGSIWAHLRQHALGRARRLPRIWSI